ncbi:MAG: hypothetical protein L3K23_08700 [Thermoplasmata archaeon]|nr:hypothetical protein [Thermoplasmata archaeon]
MEHEARRQLGRIRRALRRSGLLPFSDPRVASVVSIVAEGPVSGSWWGHPSGRLIYRVGGLIDDDPEILVLKLWAGKQTLVDRRLWPALLRIGTSRSAWQLRGMSEATTQLLDYVAHEGVVRSGQLPPDFADGSKGFASALRLLERRLLVLTRSVHTVSGTHALEAESWTTWSRRTGTRPRRGSVEAAELVIESAATSLHPDVDPRPSMPWHPRGASVVRTPRR